MPDIGHETIDDGRMRREDAEEYSSGSLTLVLAECMALAGVM